MKTSDNSFGVGGVILGILSIIFSSITGIILGIIGYTFSSKQSKLAKNKWSKIGKILNLIGIIIGIISFTFLVITLMKDPNFLSQLANSQNGQ